MFELQRSHVSEPISRIEVNTATDSVEADSWVSFRICSVKRCCTTPKLGSLELNNVLDITAGLFILLSLNDFVKLQQGSGMISCI